jgi:hypothetical protein
MRRGHRGTGRLLPDVRGPQQRGLYGRNRKTVRFIGRQRRGCVHDALDRRVHGRDDRPLRGHGRCDRRGQNCSSCENIEPGHVYSPSNSINFNLAVPFREEKVRAPRADRGQAHSFNGIMIVISKHHRDRPRDEVKLDRRLSCALREQFVSLPCSAVEPAAELRGENGMIFLAWRRPPGPSKLAARSRSRSLFSETAEFRLRPRPA